jgi:hypothetical protein
MGGLIIQWGYTTTVGTNDITTTLPITFPTQILYAISSSAYTPESGTSGYVSIGWTVGSKSSVVTRASNGGLGAAFLIFGH